MSERNRKAFEFSSSRSKGKAIGLLLAGGLLLGVAVKAGFDLTLSYTSSNEFCLSCHEMSDNAYVEFQDTIHFSNRTGVEVQCADCHVPLDTVGKIVRKVEGLRELYGKVTGKINTPEKYEMHRQAMAEKVWSDMRENDSENCRACHVNFEQNFDQQYQWARTQHQLAQQTGQTCIDCHQGIAHKPPSSRLMNKPLDTNASFLNENE